VGSGLSGQQRHRRQQRRVRDDQAGGRGVGSQRGPGLGQQPGLGAGARPDQVEPSAFDAVGGEGGFHRPHVALDPAA
jgi:hypothetical protein